MEGIEQIIGLGLKSEHKRNGEDIVEIIRKIYRISSGKIFFEF